ncbi:MAG: OmpA family protein [Pseudomonadota bacterium]
MPQLRRTVVAVTALVCAAAASAGGGYVATRFVETQVAAAASEVLSEDDSWLRLAPSGAVLGLEGEAPDARSHRAVLARLAAGGLGFELEDRTTLGDGTGVLDAQPAEVAASLEILIEGSGVTLFGEVPESTLSDKRVKALLSQGSTTNMLVDRKGKAPDTWTDVLDVAILAADLISRGHIRSDGTTVIVDGQVPEGRLDAVTMRLNAAHPDSVDLSLSLTSPAPIIAPFAYRAILDGSKLAVAACALTRVEGAAALADVISGAAEGCVVGLGAPSDDWDEVVVRGLKSLQRLGGGTLDIRSTDIALTAQVGSDPTVFADVLADLSRAQPRMYSVSGSIPPDLSKKPQAVVIEPPRFTAVRTDDGAVRIRGDLPGARLQTAAQSFAQSKFGFDTVVNETTARADLPAGWSGQVIAGLEGLAMLNRGQLEVTEAAITLTGTTPNLRVRQEVRDTLADGLPSEMAIVLNLWEEQALVVPSQTRVPATLCAEQIAVLLEGGQIVFPPSETQIDEGSLPIVDRIAEILNHCPGARFEIAGHTDSQGRESSNMALSQDRADAVLSALMERGVDTVFLSARGYGESNPIAPNDSDAGRAQNRRISFELIEGGGDQSDPVPETTDEGAVIAPDVEPENIGPLPAVENEAVLEASAVVDDVAPDTLAEVAPLAADQVVLEQAPPEPLPLEQPPSGPAPDDLALQDTADDAPPIEEPAGTVPEVVNVEAGVMTRSAQSPLTGIVPESEPAARPEPVERGPLPQIGVEPETGPIVRPVPRPSDLGE